MRLYTPSEVLIHDLFVHRDIQNALNPTLHLYNQLPIAPPYPIGGRSQGEMPIFDPMTPLGPGMTAAVVPEYPQYRSILYSACEFAGWQPRDFRGFRFRLKYPPIPSVAVFRYPLADQ